MSYVPSSSRSTECPVQLTSVNVSWLQLADSLTVAIIDECLDWYSASSLAMSCKHIYRVGMAYCHIDNRISAESLLYRIQARDQSHRDSGMSQTFSLILPAYQDIIVNQRSQLSSIPSLLRWPCPIQIILFSDDFNEQLYREDFTSFSSLQSITFGRDYNQSLDARVLPSTVTELVFTDESSFDHSFQPGALPLALRKLILGQAFNQALEPKLSDDQLESEDAFPVSLQELFLGYSFDQPLISGGVLSRLTNLTYLDLGLSYNHPILVGALPASIQVLHFDLHADFDSPIEPYSLPASLTTLEFGRYFDQPLEVGTLPESLQSLHFGRHFNQRLPVGLLPATLQSLSFGGDFNHPLEPGVLPLRLRSITFGMGFSQPLVDDSLPTSLTEIHVWDTQQVRIPERFQLIVHRHLSGTR